MLTKKDIQDKLKEFLPSIDSLSRGVFDEAVQQYLLYLTRNYSDFDVEAKELIDKTFDGFFAIAKETINRMEESPGKREKSRLLKKAQGKLFDSNLLVEALERKTDKYLEILSDTREIFIRRLQTILDFLSDVNDNKQSGIAGFAKLSLFYLCIDDLLAAFHMAQHSYINQAYSHLRSVFENLDKIDLFQKEPQWAELWSSEDPKNKTRILYELSPKSVRKKIGKEKVDPFYSFFSEMGPHGTFQSIQSHGGKLIKPSSADRTEILFWIGGCPFEHNLVSINIFLLYILVSVIHKIVQVYGRYLNSKEVIKVLVQLQDEFKQFILKYFVPWAKEAGYNIDPLVNAIDTWNINPDQEVNENS